MQKDSSLKFVSRILGLLLLVPNINGAGVHAEETSLDHRIRAQLTPYRQTTLSAEISANIATLNLREGEAFGKGATLLGFDCALLKAQQHKAEATAEVARQGLQVAERLQQLNSISRLEMEQAASRVKETEAELEAIKVTLAKCALKAPYAGRIAELHVDAYQYVTPGTPLMDILAVDRLEVQMIVPSDWLVRLKPGSRFDIRIEELGRDYRARVVRLGSRIDPVSQSLPVVGEIEGRHQELLPGMSGWVSFDKAE